MPVCCNSLAAAVSGAFLLRCRLAELPDNVFFIIYQHLDAPSKAALAASSRCLMNQVMAVADTVICTAGQGSMGWHVRQFMARSRAFTLILNSQTAPPQVWS